MYGYTVQNLIEAHRTQQLNCTIAGYDSGHWDVQQVITFKKLASRDDPHL